MSLGLTAQALNEPVIVAYKVGVFGGHAAMSQGYISYRGAFSATVLPEHLPYISGYTGDSLSGTYVNVTDVNSSGAVWGIYQK